MWVIYKWRKCKYVHVTSYWLKSLISEKSYIGIIFTNRDLSIVSVFCWVWAWAVCYCPLVSSNRCIYVLITALKMISLANASPCHFTMPFMFSMSFSSSSIVNVPGEWTLRREFLRLQTEDREGNREGGQGVGGGQQRQQVQLKCTMQFYTHSSVH